MYEVRYLISLVSNRGRKVFWAIIFDVVVLHVVIVVTVPGMAEEWVEDIREGAINEI